MIRRCETFYLRCDGEGCTTSTFVNGWTTEKFVKPDGWQRVSYYIKYKVPYGRIHGKSVELHYCPNCVQPRAGSH